MSFQYPIAGAPGNKTQGFGENPAYYKQFGQVGHNGVDYGTPVGTPVYAMDEGTISFEGWGQNHSWMGVPAGICVLINHYGSYGGYAHLTSTVVNAGQGVGKGQLIGYSGMTGAATGPHLHNEMLTQPPNFKNGYAGRIDITPYYDQPSAPQPTNNGDDDMINRDTLIRLYAVFFNRTPDDGAFDHYVGHYNTSDVVTDLYESPERAQLVAGTQNAIDSLNGRISDLTAQLAQAQSNDGTDANTISILQQQVTELTTERDNLEARLTAANAIINSQPTPTVPAPTTSNDPAMDELVSGFKDAIRKFGQFIKEVIRIK